MTIFVLYPRRTDNTYIEILVSPKPLANSIHDKQNTVYFLVDFQKKRQSKNKLKIKHSIPSKTGIKSLKKRMTNKKKSARKDNLIKNKINH